MKLKEIEFPNVYAASGALNFFGDGWWYHKFYKLLFPGFKSLYKISFVAKTTTLNMKKGNMPLKKNLQPKKIFPDCIKLYPVKGIVLNAVGLSGPGSKCLFEKNLWQNIKKPFFISFMAVGHTSDDRIEEAKKFALLLKRYLPYFKAPIGLQVNLSCPNTEHSTSKLAKEAITILRIFSSLNIPIDMKINIFFSLKLIKEIERQEICDMVTISNTIPYGSLKNRINWKKLLNSSTSPLEKYGGGGLSGKEVLPLVLNRISKMRQIGIKMPIKGGGGIMSEKDVIKMKEAGANSIEFATTAMIRPWRVAKIIAAAEKEFK